MNFVPQSFRIGNSAAWRIEECQNTSDWVLAVDRGIPLEQHTQILSYHPENIPTQESVEKVLTDKALEHRRLIEQFVDSANQAKKEFNDNSIEAMALIFKYNLLKNIIDDALSLDYVRENDGGNR